MWAAVYAFEQRVALVGVTVHHVERRPERITYMIGGALLSRHCATYLCRDDIAAACSALNSCAIYDPLAALQWWPCLQVRLYYAQSKRTEAAPVVGRVGRAQAGACVIRGARACDNQYASEWAYSYTTPPGTIAAFLLLQPRRICVTV
jgi:hypothetical protein